VRSAAERPDLRRAIEAVDALSYPSFMRHSQLAAYWDAVYRWFPEWQLVLLDGESGGHLAHGNAVPFTWDGTFADLPRTAAELVRRALRDRQRGIPTTAIGALQAVVNPARRRRGLSAAMLMTMASHAQRRGLRQLLAPIRPTAKSHHPLARFESYVRWTRLDGLPYDPWQRIHHRLGATPMLVVPAWLTVTGSAAQWAGWAGMDFPRTGSYIVRGALMPVEIDRERDRGRYVEPHLWMRYGLGAT
jgi:hypothetical protein